MCIAATLKKTENWFQDQLSLNAGQKYCRMLSYRLMQAKSIAECSKGAPREHSAIITFDLH